MSSVAVLLALVVPSVAVLAALAAPRAPLPDGADRLARVARTTHAWRLGGLLLGGAAAAVAVAAGSLGRGPMLAVPIVAWGLLGGVLVGEMRVDAPSGAERRAELEVRRVRDVLPPGLAAAAAGCTGYLLTLLAVTTAMGSADDLGRPGRALAVRCTEALTEARTPWPGTYYSLPLAALVVGGALGAALALARVRSRPRQGEDRATDDALRRDAARAVVAATGLLAAAPLLGIAPVTVIALNGTSCAPTAWRVGAVVLLATVPAVLALTTWFVAVLVRTSLGRDRRRTGERVGR